MHSIARQRDTPEMAMTSRIKLKASTPIRWVVLSLASLVAVVCVFTTVSYAVQVVSYVTSLHRTPNLNMIISVVPGILFLAGYALSWWRERLGGTLFILASVAIGLQYFHLWLNISSISNQHMANYIFRAWAPLGLTPLIIGILFIVVLPKIKRSKVSPYRAQVIE